MTTPPVWFPSWLTQNYLIDADRYIAARSRRRPFDGSEPDVDENGDERQTTGPVGNPL